MDLTRHLVPPTPVTPVAHRQQVAILANILTREAALSSRHTTHSLFLDLHTPTTALTVRPYCGCAAPTCPMCATTLSADTWTGSAHALAAAPAAWGQMGYVSGQGVPNFWLRSPPQGLDIRIWWGAYMEDPRACSADPYDLEDAVEPLKEVLRAHDCAGQRDRIWERTRQRRATITDPGLAWLLKMADGDQGAALLALLDLLDIRDAALAQRPAAPGRPSP